METKLCSSDKEEAVKRELPYCIGEIDFTASGKKRGKNESLVRYQSDDNIQGPLYSLDHNHSHFILVDHITPHEPDGTTKLRLTLEKHISEQRTGYGGTGSIEIPVLCLLVNGGPGTLEIQNIISHQHLLTLHNFEQDSSEELDTVILKALVKACKSHSQDAQEYLDELKLAVAWNRVDIAKSEIFNGDVEWKSCDLEEVMMDALVNDKPEFVKLFIDNGANISEFLTYSRLQRLYCSISQKCLLYELLLKKHEESKLTLAGLTGQQHKEQKEICPLFTLSEVSRVLKDFLHDACKGFYQDLRHGGKKKSGQEGVASALAACKILKEMSRLETETEVAHIMKEAKYEQLAVELFSECYHNSEERAFALLVRKTQYWSKTTCLQLATEADAKSFFAHDGVQSFYTDEDTNLMKKFKLYVEDNWNKCDMVTIFLFIIGVACRMLNSTFQAGRTILAIDFMVFTLRLIHIFAIHKQLGPKIIIVERMMKDVFFFLFFLSVWLIAYGVTTQALLHPDDSRVEWIFRRVLYRPYLQIFGQIPLDEIDTSRMYPRNCTPNPLQILQENSPSCPNSYANWLVILLLVVFLLVTNVLLMNLLIAMFSYTFQVVQGNADIFWKIQRYNLIVEYYGRPALAPPFIIINHITLVLRRIFNKMEHRKEHLERDLPVGLDQKIVTWELVQKENYLVNLEQERKESNEERLKATSNKVDNLSKYFSGLKEQEKRFKVMEAQIKPSVLLNYCRSKIPIS
ncbi:transient receptor potential cation channel subfamily M member 5 [Grus japonensis]|uniref:Transient receptor potential cation channel subfamily M member 5 n=1 Tax=Grus japonensis TaxID=30415 RepID=A0ABC9WX47_GRUJA